MSESQQSLPFSRVITGQRGADFPSVPVQGRKGSCCAPDRSVLPLRLCQGEAVTDPSAVMVTTTEELGSLSHLFICVPAAGAGKEWRTTPSCTRRF